MPHPIKVAFIAAEEDGLPSAWRGDPDVEARLVPMNAMLVREIAGADVVHVLSAARPSALFSQFTAVLAARAMGKPVVWHDQSGGAPHLLQRSLIARLAMQLAHTRVVTSRIVADACRGLVDATIVPNAVDLERLKYRERDPVRPRLLCARHFSALDNVAATIRAFAIVQQRWPAASLTLLGSGAQDGALRALAAGLGLRDVTFAGDVPRHAMAGYYDDSDIYVQSPNVDTLPARVLDAFASGLPVVSTAAGSVPEILTHGVHGLLAPLADYETLGHHVLRLLAHPTHARQLARAAHKTCAAYAWPVVREQWLNAYRRVLPVWRPSAARDLSSASPPRPA